jgi:lipopolysaccharide transport system permease protein
MTNEILIAPNARGGVNYWRDLWRARELLFFLAWRDVVVKYKHAVLGILWVVLRPVLTTIAFTFVFGKIAKLPAGEIPYPLLVLSGVTPWFFFATTVSETGTSLVNNSALITKVYFPRLVIPAGIVLANSLDFAIAGVLLALMMLFSGIALSWAVICLPVVVAVLALFAISTGLWISALNAKYRDVQYVIPFLITFGQYMSPVGFATSVVPEQWLWLFQLNPIVGIIDGFRWCLFGDVYFFQPWTLLYSFTFSVVLLISGIAYFRAVEREIIDFL